MSSDKIATYMKVLKVGFDRTLSDAANVPIEKRLVQLKEHKAHPLWLIGHLTNTLNMVCLHWSLGKDPVLPKEWGKMFAPDFAKGDPVVSDGSKYPAWDDVVVQYQSLSNQALEAIGTLTDADLESPARGPMPEMLKRHFSSLEAMIIMLIEHDAHHRGQMALLAKL